MNVPDPNPDGAHWLRYAREDLAEAERMLTVSSSVPRHACYLAQQAAEKALKTVLIYLRLDYPFSHNLNLIRDLIPAGWPLKVAHPNLGGLTAWAITSRYPTDVPDATIDDAWAACGQARAVLESVTSDLRDHGFPA